MNKSSFCPWLAVASLALLCGCDKQAKLNSAKNDLLSRNVVQFERDQAGEMAAIQTKLASLGPMLDKMNDFYFEKTHDQAFFFHTNTLYLILTVDKKIEAHLQQADTERAAQNAQAYAYYTNQVGMTFLCGTQIQNALAAQEGRTDEKIGRAVADLREELQRQINPATPDADEIARRKQVAADVAEMKRELGQIRAQLAALKTN